MVMNKTAQDYFEQAKAVLAERTFYEIVQRDPKWKSIEQKFYQPLCDEASYPPCRLALNGALLHGLPSTFIEFHTLLFEAYFAFRDRTTEVAAEDAQNLLMETYYGYAQIIRPLLFQSKKVNQDILDSYLDQGYQDRWEMIYALVPSLLLLLVLAACWVDSAHKKQLAIIQETLTYVLRNADSTQSTS